MTVELRSLKSDAMRTVLLKWWMHFQTKCITAPAVEDPFPIELDQMMCIGFALTKPKSRTPIHLSLSETVPFETHLPVSEDLMTLGDFVAGHMPQLVHYLNTTSTEEKAKQLLDCIFELELELDKSDADLRDLI